MTTIKQMRDLLTQSVTLRKLTRSSAGDLSVGTEYANVPAEVQYARTTTYDKNGEVVALAATVFLAADCQITPDGEWRVIHGERVLEVVEISPVFDARTGSVHHYEVITK